MSEPIAVQTISISLPEAMARFVEEQVRAGEYANVSEYVRDLVRADQKRHAKRQLEQVLLSAAGSGDPFEVTPDKVDAVWQKVRGSE